MINTKKSAVKVKQYNNNPPKRDLYKTTQDDSPQK